MAIAINFDSRDPETGLLIKNHTSAQRQHWLLRHPATDPATLPPVVKNSLSPAWETPTHVGGRPWFAEPRRAALLADPAPVRSVTKPTPIKYTTMMYAAHEAAHCRVAIACGFEVARVSVIPDGTTGGRVIHSQDGSRATQGIVLAAGREGELLMFGTAGDADSQDAKRARKLALEEANGDEQRAEQLLSAWRTVAKRHVKAHERSIRKLAFELHRRRQLDWAEITAVIDSAVQRSIPKQQQELRKVAPKQPRIIREFDFSKQADIRAWNKQQGNEDLDREPIGFGVGHIVTESFR